MESDGTKQTLDELLVETVRGRYLPVHEAFNNDEFRRRVLDLYDRNIKVLLIEPDAQLRYFEASDLAAPLAFAEIAEYVVDQVPNKPSETILTQLFDEGYLKEYGVLYISPTVDPKLKKEILRRIEEDQINVKIISLEDLETLCAEVIPADQRHTPIVYTPDIALKQLRRVTEDIRGGANEAVLELLHLDSLLCPIFDPDFKPTSPIARGYGASAGCAFSPFFTDLGKAMHYVNGNNGRKVIFVTDRLTSKHVPILPYTAGLITNESLTEGTHTMIFIHTAGVPCISGCGMTSAEDGVYFGSRSFHNGSIISMDGSLGEVYEGQYPVVDSPIIKDAKSARSKTLFKPHEHTRVYREFLAQLKRIIQENNGMHVYSFVSDTSEAYLASILSKNGGDPLIDGIGMVKTENHFTREHERQTLADLLLGDSPARKEDARNAIYEQQFEIFHDLLNFMKGMPVQIRLIDGLGELFPDGPLHSSNPLDFRGPDIALEYPEIYKVQLESMVSAAYAAKESGAELRIVIPFIRNEKEFETIQRMLEDAYQNTGINKKDVNVKLGVMLETPSARHNLSQLYQAGVGFFVLGTNDLTSTTLCLARGRTRMTHYRAIEGIFPKDPFEHLEEPIKTQVRIDVKRIKVLDPNLSVGVTGRHARDPQSIIYFHNIGVDYVAVPPYEIASTLHNVAKAAYMSPR